MRNIFIFFIVLYQRTLSPDHGIFRARFPYGYCRHYPSCSEYTKQAISRHGPGQGVLLGLKRIVRCNPFVRPSIDEVPNYQYPTSNEVVNRVPEG